MTDFFSRGNICMLLWASFSPHKRHREYMTRLTTGCDGNSPTYALHICCFVIVLKSMQSRNSTPLFASL